MWNLGSDTKNRSAYLTVGVTLIVSHLLLYLQKPTENMQKIINNSKTMSWKLV